MKTRLGIVGGAAGLMVVLLAAQSVLGDREPSAWFLIESVRAALAADGRLQADFTQTYTPAGFATGESDHGRLALSLPDCLRWDYTGDEKKTFLLCGRDAYHWLEGDPEGRHQRIESRDEPGLDLLLLPLDHLRQRYEATMKTGSDGTVISLVPRARTGDAKGDKHSPLAAELVLDAAAKRLLSLSYTDREGNRTRFAIDGYRPLQDGSLFVPPVAMRWREE